eukprot:TRINITY_DN12642_c0_g1_i1.p2 TRINITY_DN12642_c0_g1~~TRINITY_DN12642_c0_g1_i1.p2  ORF type:complete len:102 (+),score=2.72 TRINITY_DN12642_c0_g1_i1:130-435(+)
MNVVNKILQKDDLSNYTASLQIEILVEKLTNNYQKELPNIVRQTRNREVSRKRYYLHKQYSRRMHAFCERNNRATYYIFEREISGNRIAQKYQNGGIQFCF